MRASSGTPATRPTAVHVPITSSSQAPANTPGSSAAGGPRNTARAASHRPAVNVASKSPKPITPRSASAWTYDVLDAVRALGRGEGFRGRVRELAPRVVEVVAVDLLLLPRGLPAGARDRVVEEDLPADVREHRALDVRLHVLLRGRVVLADAEKADELVDVAAAHDEDADRDRADDATEAAPAER